MSSVVSNHDPLVRTAFLVETSPINVWSVHCSFLLSYTSFVSLVLLGLTLRISLLSLPTCREGERPVDARVHSLDPFLPTTTIGTVDLRSYRHSWGGEVPYFPVQVYEVYQQRYWPTNHVPFSPFPFQLKTLTRHKILYLFNERRATLLCLFVTL